MTEPYADCLRRTRGRQEAPRGLSPRWVSAPTERHLPRARRPAGRLLGGLAATLPRGAKVGRVAARAHVVPDAAVVAGAVIEGAAAEVVLAGLQTRPDASVLGPPHLECDRSEQRLPPAARGFE